MSGIGRKLKAPLYGAAYIKYSHERSKALRKREALISADLKDVKAPEGAVRVVSFAGIRDFFNEFMIREQGPEILVFAKDPQDLTDTAPGTFAEAFGKLKDTLILYGDSLKKGASPTEAFFRPDWSPDFFLDAFYIGGCFAMRTEALRGVIKDTDFDTKASPEAAAFNLFARAAAHSGAFKKGHGASVGHIPEILYFEDFSSEAPLYKKAAGAADSELLKICGAFTDPELFKPGISALILSKDHPELFIKCHETLRECSEGTELQVILVDNGSGDENRRKLSEYCSEQGIRYIYEPCDFNFSKLCNIAAKAAEKDFLLFCNDDVEFRDHLTLFKLAQTAARDRVGLSGCRLLYPDGRIQHAGVFNVKPGPMHKLQFRENSGDLYFGMGSSVINVMSATAACVMVKKQVFDEAGGFDEELAVAFNDVALGFKIFSLGYDNVCRNDISCIHKESVTRGNDALDTAKIARLMRERDLLYAKFPEYKGYDPYLNLYLDNTILDSGFIPGPSGDEPDRVTLKPVTDRAIKELALSQKDDPVLNVGIEYCGRESDYVRGGSKDTLILTGFCFVGGFDNCSVCKKLVLRSEGRLYEAYLNNRFRSDIENNVPDQKNVAFAGFSVSADFNAVCPGTYEVCILAYDRFSGLKLLRDSGRRLIKE